MPPLKAYRRFLEDMILEVSAALAEAENLGWHHKLESPEGLHYLRLGTWAVELEKRMAWYDHIKAPRL